MVCGIFPVRDQGVSKPATQHKDPRTDRPFVTLPSFLVFIGLTEPARPALPTPGAFNRPFPAGPLSSVQHLLSVGTYEDAHREPLIQIISKVANYLSINHV